MFAGEKSLLSCWLLGHLGLSGSPAVLLSDKRALCNITSPVATSSKLGLIFANVLQVDARGLVMVCIYIYTHIISIWIQPSGADAYRARSSGSIATKLPRSKAACDEKMTTV